MKISDHVGKLRYYMEFRKYSKESVKNYCSCLTSFFAWCESRGAFHPDRITSDMVIEFLKQFDKPNTHSGYHSAIKLYFEKVAHVGVEKFKYIERPKKEKRLPIIIDNADVQKLMDVCKNVKQKAIMLTLYGTGVRRTELLNIKIADIDSKRMVIRVIGKGNKERLVPLGKNLLIFLRKYYKEYKPKVWLFENDSTHLQYSAGSIKEFLNKYKFLAGIKSPVTPHKFRHSNATMLLETGTDLRVIQEALGHSSSKTTEIYTHVSGVVISRIVAPDNFINC